MRSGSVSPGCGSGILQFPGASTICEGGASSMGVSLSCGSDFVLARAGVAAS
jgi:hypothetical protein